MRSVVMVSVSLGIAACSGKGGSEPRETADTGCADGLVAQFTDADLDGYGDGATEELVCGAVSAEAGISDNGLDCDDTRASVFPGAVEVCGDLVVNDCDGDADAAAEACRLPESVDLATEADAVVSGDPSGELLGSALADIGDIDGDGQPELAVGAEAGSVAELDLYGHGVVRVFSGPYGGELSLDGAVATLAGYSSSGLFGDAVAGPGDVNGDGYDDLVVGASYDLALSSADRPGAAWLIAGPVTGAHKVSEVGLQMVGDVDGDRAGYAVSGVYGDWGDEGLADLVVSAKFASPDSSGDYAGAVYCVAGGQVESADVGTDWTLSAAQGVLYGAEAGDYTGGAVSATGDADGDGIGDVLIGATGLDLTFLDQGGAYLVYGPVSGSMTLEDADVAWHGEGEAHRAGASVAYAGDVDGDGREDVAIGAPGFNGDNAGAVYVDTAAVSRRAVSRGLGDATGRLIGWDEEDYTGTSVWGPGDVDGDGKADVLVGAPGAANAAGEASGGAWLVYGPVEGAAVLGDVETAGLIGWDEEDFTGSAVSGSADLSGDGVPDLLVGAEQAGGYAGAAYVVFGAGL